MRNVKLTLSYDGTDFAGWQRQVGFRTVQQVFEEAVFAVTGETVHANASGRTDAGVHAVGQVVNVRLGWDRPAPTLLRAINANLPVDVVVRLAEDVPDDFDANRQALWKLYRYVIHDEPVADPFLRRFCMHSSWRLDEVAMAEGAKALEGRHDFRSFETNWPNRLSSVRQVRRLAVNRVGGYLWLDIEADGFLYNMVRSIAGTLLNVGRGHWPPSSVGDILHAQDRRQAGPTAPARGLFLMRVRY